MSLTQGLRSPHTPLRRFLGRELSAGTRRLRANFRARLPAGPIVLPGEAVGYEAGTVGTAIDQRLRLAFSVASPVDTATMLGVAQCQPSAATSRRGSATRDAVATVGLQLTDRLRTLVAEHDLDNRTRPFLRADDDEEHLARLLLAAAWYAVAFRNPFAFPDTPLCQAAIQDPRTFTLDRLLALPHRHLVDDLIAQLHAAEINLSLLRKSTTPQECSTGPTFDGSADISGDADLIAAGLLIDFKSSRDIARFDQGTMLQLLGYALMDYSDQHQIAELGVYLTRAGALVTWPIEEYLALLGARRRDINELRSVFAALLGYKPCRADDDPLPEQLDGVNQLLDELAPVIAASCCQVCAQPLRDPITRSGRPRRYCSQFCSNRSQTLRKHGWLD